MQEPPPPHPPLPSRPPHLGRGRCNSHPPHPTTPPHPTHTQPTNHTISTLLLPPQAVAAPDMPAVKPRKRTALEDVVVVGVVRLEKPHGARGLQSAAWLPVGSASPPQPACPIGSSRLGTAPYWASLRASLPSARVLFVWT